MTKHSKGKAKEIINPSLSVSKMTEEINDSEWSCSVVMIVENSIEAVNFIKSLENCSKLNIHRIIKIVSFKSLEGTKQSQRSQTKKKNQINVNQYNDSNTTELSKKIKKIIYSHKLDDILLRNFAKEGFKNKDFFEKSKMEDNTKNDVFNEPLYGPSMYFILTGFYDPYLPFEMLKQNIPLQAIINLYPHGTGLESKLKIGERSILKGLKLNNSSESVYRKFWITYQHLDESYSYLNRLTSNVPIIKVRIHDSDVASLKADDRDLNIYNLIVGQIFSIQKEFRNYLNLMENTKVMPVKEEPHIDINALKSYSSSMESIPSENACVQVILFYLLDAIEISEKNPSFRGEYFNQKQSTDSHGCLRNDTPYILNYNDEFSKKNFHLKLNTQLIHNFYLNILSQMPFIKIWFLFPHLKPLEFAWIKSHFQKIWRFMREQIKEQLMEIVIHKAFFNKIVSYLTDEDKNFFIIEHIPNLKLPSDFEFGFQNLFSDKDSFYDLSDFSLITMFDEIGVDLKDEDYRDGEGFSRDSSFAGERSTTSSFVRSMTVASSSYSSKSEIFDGKELTEKPDKEETNVILDEEDSYESLENLNPFDEKYKAIKRAKALKGLKIFLDFPELDGLFTDQISGFRDLLSEYKVVEVLKKYSCLQTLEKYFSEYHFVDYVHYKTTDSLLLIFHNKSDKSGMSKYNTKGILPTPVGFRDYIYYVRNEEEMWIQSQEDSLKERDRIFLKTKGVGDERNASDCCLDTLRKQGLFAKTDTRAYYQMHVPFSNVKMAGSGAKSTFLCYDLGTGRIQCDEFVKLFNSVTGKSVEYKHNSWVNSPIKDVSLHVSHLNNSVIYHYRLGTDDDDANKNMITFESFNKTRITFINRVDSESEMKMKEIVKDSSSRTEKDFSSTNISEDNTNDLIITTANGLQISLVQIDNGEICIKQTFLNKNPVNDSLMEEKYRLFLKNGTILIYKEDGTIAVLYPNSTKVNIFHVAKDCVEEIIHTNPSKENQTKPSKENTSQTKKKEVDKGKKIKPPEPLEPSYIKKNKKIYVLGKHEVISWSGLRREFVYDFCRNSSYPYTVRAAYDGNYELFVIRSDGTKCLFSSDGSLQVQYFDGTRISTLPYFVDPLPDSRSNSEIYSDKEESEDLIDDLSYSFIEMEVTMEHQNYACIKFSVEGVWTISLPDKISINFSSHRHINMIIGEDFRVNMFHLTKTLYCQRINEFEKVISESSIHLFNSSHESLYTHKDKEMCYVIDFDGRTRHLDYTTDEFSHIKRLYKLDTDFMSRYRSHDKFSVAAKSEISTISYKIPHSFRLFVLKRDLSGYEFLQESENDYIETKGLESFKDDCNKFQPSSHEEDGTMVSQYPLEFTLPELFFMTYIKGDMMPINLNRSDLSKPISKNIVWLFDLRSTQLNKISSSQLLASIEHEHTPCKAIMLRKIITCNSEYSVMFKEALEAYLGFKSVTFAFFKKNVSIPVMKEEEAEQKFNVLLNAIAALRRCKERK